MPATPPQRDPGDGPAGTAQIAARELSMSGPKDYGELDETNRKINGWRAAVLQGKCKVIRGRKCLGEHREVDRLANWVAVLGAAMVVVVMALVNRVNTSHLETVV